MEDFWLLTLVRYWVGRRSTARREMLDCKTLFLPEILC